MAWEQCENLTWSTSIPFGTIRNNFWFRTSLIRQPSHLQTFKLDQLRLTLDSSSKILCSPQYLLPPETVIRQKRCFRFKKKAQVIRSLCKSSAILGIYWFMHWTIQPLARQTVWPLCPRFSISSSPLLAKTKLIIRKIPDDKLAYSRFHVAGEFQTLRPSFWVCHSFTH